jgi:molybdate transport system substrate-binding protein
VAGLLTAACGLVAGTGAAVAENLAVSVAVSLRPAVVEAVRGYRNERPGFTVALNAGGSAVLLQQARHGAPVDLFLSASPQELDRLETMGRLRFGSRRDLASNRLVVLVPRGADPPAGIDELRRPEFDLIAMGNPRTAPVGRYAEEALETLGLLEILRDRLVLAENSRQLADYVARGEVAAGLAYRTDALLLEGRVVTGAAVPPESHAPVLYQGAVFLDAKHPEAAEDFLDFLTSAKGQRILQRHGFAPPP